MHALETFRIGAFVAEIYPDDAPESPRDWCNLGRMWTFDRRYNSPDDCPSTDPREAMEFLACELFPQTNVDNYDDSELMRLIEKRAVILRVFKFEHSGVAYSTTPFNDPWDSGQVGWIFATRADILKEYGGTRLTQAKRDKAAQLLRGEVETYSQWANGEVYGYQIHSAENPDDPNDNTHNDDCLDSCWGFYGFDYVRHEARVAAAAE